MGRTGPRSVSALRAFLGADLAFLLVAAAWSFVVPARDPGHDAHLLRISALVAWAILDVECWRLDRGALALRRILGVFGGVALLASAVHWEEPRALLAVGGVLCIASAALAAVVLRRMSPEKTLVLLREIFDSPAEGHAKPRQPGTHPPSSREPRPPSARVPRGPNPRRRGVPLLFTAIGCLWVAAGAIEVWRGPFWWWGLPVAAAGAWIVATAPEFVPRLARGVGRRRMLANAPPAILVLFVTLVVLARATWLVLGGPLDASGPAAAVRKGYEPPR